MMATALRTRSTKSAQLRPVNRSAQTAISKRIRSARSAPSSATECDIEAHSVAEEGADLADRMRFDIAVCALRLTGLSWADFVERVRNAVAIIVLLTDGYDPSLARAFKSNEVFVLSKPANPAEIRNICANAESLEERSPVLR